MSSKESESHKSWNRLTETSHPWASCHIQTPRCSCGQWFWHMQPPYIIPFHNAILAHPDSTHCLYVQGRVLSAVTQSWDRWGGSYAHHSYLCVIRSVVSRYLCELHCAGRCQCRCWRKPDQMTAGGAGQCEINSVSVYLPCFLFWPLILFWYLLPQYR